MEVMALLWFSNFLRVCWNNDMEEGCIDTSVVAQATITMSL
jgi:hypothetical protein